MVRENRVNSNPARGMEIAAVGHISDWLGDNGTVTDTGDGHEPDFYIEYNDERTGWGEVGWHEEGRVRALQKEIEKQGQVELPAGSGEWMVHLLPDARIKDLQKSLVIFIQLMIGHGLFELSPFANLLPQQILDEAERLQIDAATRPRPEELMSPTSCHRGRAVFYQQNQTPSWTGLTEC